MKIDLNATNGLEMDAPLPDGWVPAGAVVVVRCIDFVGRRRMTTRYAGDVMAWEAKGMLGVAERDVDRHLDAIHGETS